MLEAGSGVRFLEFPKARVPRPLPPGAGSSLREAPPALPAPGRAPDDTHPLRPPTRSFSGLSWAPSLEVVRGLRPQPLG